jgi:cyclopropane-fatty-acyl-phospholipid synthase
VDFFGMVMAMIERFSALMRDIVRRGTLLVTLPGTTAPLRFGDGTSPRVRISIRDRATIAKLLCDPEVQVGEAWMDGTLTVEEGTLYDFLMLVSADVDPLTRVGAVAKFVAAVRRACRRVLHYNPIGAASRRVRSHYDLSDRLFDLFLDSERQYSCAYFPTPQTGLDEAQHAKMRHIASKLRIEPGQRVLDIGSGWGGLGLYFGRAGCDVTGITLSVGQHAVANARAQKEGLAERVHFDLLDYRRLGGTFDRIVSVGMLEHVGSVHFRTYFAKIAEVLADDGVALIHAIGRSDGPGTTNAWITHHIFPGGYIPALSEVVAAIESSGLLLTDVEILRLHYAETLAEWRRRFLARRAEAVALYDERFARMWEFYLAASEAAFRWGGLFVFQLQIAHRVETLPIVRDYMVDEERRTAPTHGERRIRSCG